MNCGLMYQSMIDTNENGTDEYRFTPFAKVMDIIALSYDNVARYPDPVKCYQAIQTTKKSTEISNSAFVCSEYKLIKMREYSNAPPCGRVVHCMLWMVGITWPLLSQPCSIQSQMEMTASFETVVIQQRGITFPRDCRSPCQWPRRPYSSRTRCRQ